MVLEYLLKLNIHIPCDPANIPVYSNEMSARSHQKIVRELITTALLIILSEKLPK